MENTQKVILHQKKARTLHSLIVGSAGTGKTHTVKEEIVSLQHENKGSKFIIIDVNGEYKKFAEECNGEVVDFVNTFINPCEIAEYSGNIADMANFITSFFEIIAEKKCNSFQKIICDVCSSIYSLYAIGQQSESNTVIKRDECPTLEDFYNKLTSYKDGKEFYTLCEAIEPYCKGLFNFFAHKTNVNPDSRLIVIDLSAINERQIPLALQTSLMYTWSVMAENRFGTFVYLEEFNRYFKEPALANTLSYIFKRSIQKSGVITGIVQDFDSLFCYELFPRFESIVLFPKNKFEIAHVKSFFKSSDVYVL